MSSSLATSLEGVIRLRMSTADGHYAGGLVDGARILHLFGDAITELLIRHDGDEGLSRVMTSEFLAPVRNGDYIEIRARLVSVGKSSRTIECTAHKIIELGGPNDSSARLLAEPLLVARCTDIAVVPLDKQRPATRHTEEEQ
jgi:3-aminobutyryl-CoA ammonia-lyase